MRKIIMAINATPEGFCDHRAVVADEALHDFYAQLMKHADLMLFGRKTFQLMDPYWPSVAKDKTGTPGEIAFAQGFTDIRKIVFSKKGFDTDCPNTEILDAIIPADVLQWKQQPGKDIFVGSPSIVDQLAQHGLIDEYIFLMQPIIGGNGKRFFESIKLEQPVNLHLRDTKSFPSGSVALFYTVSAKK